MSGCSCHPNLLTNARKGSGSKILRKDPTRTLMIRDRFSADIKRRFKALKNEVVSFIVTLDALGLQERKPLTLATVQPRQFEFHTDAGKLTAFNDWLRQQIDAKILSFIPDQRASLQGPWTTGYIESAYKRGAINAYLASKQGSLLDDNVLQQGLDEFLRTSFGAAETLSKIQLLATRSFEQLKGITASMGADMNQILAQGMIDGSSAIEIARNMTDRIDTLTNTRALLIAQTETIYAHAEGQLDSFQRLGVTELGVKAEWLTAGDDRVCPLCQANEGNIYTIDEARGLIPLHPRCRCTWIPFLPVTA